MTTSAVANYRVAMLPKALVTEPSIGWLTPDVLMSYCQSKIRGIDEQVQKAFTGQQNRNQLSTALGELAQTIGNYSAGIADGVDGDNPRAAVRAAYAKALAKVGENTDVGKKLKAALDGFEATAGVQNNGLSTEEMKSQIDAVGRVQADVNREGELEMIQLQSLMSQRQQALQMCTNMVQSLGQSASAIAQNVGK